jgi:hypothetical protein
LNDCRRVFGVERVSVKYPVQPPEAIFDGVPGKEQKTNQADR